MKSKVIERSFFCRSTNDNSIAVLKRTIINLVYRQDKQVQFRESKLTYLLKEALNGNSRLCIIATILPECFSSSESIKTIKFASFCRKIPIKAKINEISMDNLGFLEEISHEKNILKDG